MTTTAPPPVRRRAAARPGAGAGAARWGVGVACVLGPFAVTVGAGAVAGQPLVSLFEKPLAWVLWLVLTAVLLGGFSGKLALRPLARHLSLLLTALAAALGVVALGWMRAGWQAEGWALAALVLALPLVCGVLPWQRRLRRFHFALLPGGIAGEVGTLPAAQWLRFRAGDKRVDAHAIVADFHAPHPTATLNALATHAMRGTPLVDAAAAHELLTERVALRFLAEESIQEYGRAPAYDALKRVLDVLVVALCLPVVVPLAALVAVAVRLESPGPVLFRQRRVGHLGRPFTMVKFRSMDHRVEALEPQFTLAGDARVTRLGRLIRLFRVDELPQFWNVLRGEMSLIGPRPEQVPFVETFEEVIPLYPYRHTVRPGITGWSQVKLGYAASEHEAVEKLEYDLYYVKHRSFALDLLIAFKTLRTIVTGYGAR